jgi:hypothetical protein
MKYLKTHSKLYTIVITAVAMFVITSCNSAKNDSKQPTQSENQEQTMEQNNMMNTETEAIFPDNANVTDDIEKPEISGPASEPTEQAGTVQNNAEVMLNPPHGEPFHRCDIPVGAPLDSQPASTTRQTTTNQTTTAAPRAQNPAPSTANNPTAPTIENAMRMNPSQTRSTTPANSGTKPRLNPAHGQPWHRCDIAVGSPLP